MQKICAECGHKNLDDANFCEKCGIRLQGSSPKADKDEKIVKPVKTGKSRGNIKDWWNKQSSRSKALNLIIAGLGVILILGVVGIITSTTNQTNQNNTTNTLEIEKMNKIKAIENSTEFKQALNDYIENNYAGSDPKIKVLAVKEIKSDNLIVVELEVEYTSDSGEIKTHHYLGTWVFTDGTWQKGEDFEYTTV